MQKYCSASCALWHRVDIRAPNECWNWMGYRKKGAYGALTFHGKRMDTHRLAFVASGGNAQGLFVCHKCDNPICCNPKHLFAGTPLDNTRDMDTKGRRKSGGGGRKGEKHHGAKLSEADVLAIRGAYHPRWDAKGVALRYGVSKALLHNIVRRKAWKHI